MSSEIDVGHFSDFSSDELNILLQYLEFSDMIQMCGVNTSTYNVSATHPNWRLFVLQSVDFNCDAYMKSIEATVNDSFKWRRILIYCKQVRDNFQNNRCKMSSEILRRSGEAVNFHRRRSYRGTVECADSGGTTFFWDDGSVIHQLQGCLLVRKFETGQTFKYPFPRVASYGDRLFVCLNDCIKMWDLRDSKQQPQSLTQPVMGDVARGRHHGSISVVLLVQHQRLILLKNTYCLIWDLETLKFLFCLWHVEDDNVQFGRSRESQRENSKFEVMWMGKSKMVTWSKKSNFVNVWSLSDGSRIANLTTEESVVKVSATRVTWVSREHTEHFVMVVLDRKCIITFWNSIGYVRMYRFFCSCERAFDVVLTQDFLGIMTESNTAKIDFIMFKCWFHDDFNKVENEWESSDDEVMGHLESYEYHRALLPLHSPVDYEAVRYAQRLRDLTVAVPSRVAALRLSSTRGQVDASAAIGCLDGKIGPWYSLMNFDCRYNVRMIKRKTVPNSAENLPSMISFGNFLAVSCIYRSGNDSLHLWKSSTFDKFKRFGTAHGASCVKFNERMVWEVTNGCDGKEITLNVYDFRPMAFAFEKLPPGNFLGAGTFDDLYRHLA